MLFAYLYFLGKVTDSIMVLFIDSHTRPKKLSDVRVVSVVGVVPGIFIYKVFSSRFPELLRLEIYENGSRRPSREILQEWYQGVSEDYFNDDDEYLSEIDVRRWFGIKMSSTIIDADITDTDRKSIQHALAREEDFLIVADGEKLSAIVSLCKLTIEISRKQFVELWGH